jgi:tRNA U55 pseudouridine synthase TruB
MALGVGAHLTALRRTAIGPYRVDNALDAESLVRHTT